jgi:hypothetical protein
LLKREFAMQKHRGGAGQENGQKQNLSAAMGTVPEKICFLHEGHVCWFMDVQSNGWCLCDSLCQGKRGEAVHEMLKESTTQEATDRNGIVNSVTRKTLHEDSTLQREKVKAASFDTASHETGSNHESTDLRTDPGLRNQIPSAHAHSMFRSGTFWLQLPQGRTLRQCFLSHSFPPQTLTMVLCEFEVAMKLKHSHLSFPPRPVNTESDWLWTKNAVSGSPDTVALCHCPWSIKRSLTISSPKDLFSNFMQSSGSSSESICQGHRFNLIDSKRSQSILSDQLLQS